MRLLIKFDKALVFILCLLPFAGLLYLGGSGQLGPDAGKALVLETGEWTIRFLVATLAISPLRWLTGRVGLVRYRRMVGLFCWFYASLHFMCVLTYLLGWSWVVFIEEFAERPYMAVGISAWLLLVPLALTSNRWSQKKLGRHWKSLHQLIYPIAILACIHVIWLVRSSYAEALVYSLLIITLLVMRLYKKFVPVAQR